MKKRTVIISVFVFLLGGLAVSRSSGQSIVATVPVASNEIIDMHLYESGGKLFLADLANTRILVYSAVTFGFLPGFPLFLFAV